MNINMTQKHKRLACLNNFSSKRIRRNTEANVMGMGSAEDRREQQISKYNHDQFRSMLGIENDGYGRDDIHSHIPPSQRLSKNLNSDRLRRNKSIDIYIKNDGRSLKDRENSADPDFGENIAQLNQIKKIKHNGDLDSIAQQIKFISRRFKLAADGQPRINGNNDSSWMKDILNYGVVEPLVTANKSYGCFPDMISKLEIKINKLKLNKFSNTGTFKKLMFVDPLSL